MRRRRFGKKRSQFVRGKLKSILCRPKTYITTLGLTLDCKINQLAIRQIGLIGSFYDIYTMFFAWFQEMYAGMTDQNGNLSFGYSNATLNTAEWLIEKWNCSYKMTNCSNVPIDVIMYEYVARRDMPSTTATNTFPASGPYTPDLTWSDMILLDAVQGSQQSGAYIGGNATTVTIGPSGWPSNPGASTVLGFDLHYDQNPSAAVVSTRIGALTNAAGSITYAKPYNGLNITQDFSIYRCPLFCRRFKIVRRKVMRCLPGGQCYYMFKQRRPKLIKMSNYLHMHSMNSDHGLPVWHQCLDGEKGYFRGLLCQLKGQIGNDSTVKDNVGTSIAGLNILCNESVTITWNPIRATARSVKYGAQRATGASGYLFNKLDPTAMVTYPLANPASSVTVGTTH